MIKIKTICKILQNTNIIYHHDIEQKGYLLEQVTFSPEIYKNVYKKIGEKYCWWIKQTWSEDELRQHLEQPFVKTYWIKFHKQIIGFCEIHFYEGDSVYLQYFGLFDNFIGNGHGDNSFKTVTNVLKKFYFTKKIIITTNNLDHENALKLYIKNGFSEIEEVEEIWNIPDENLVIITERNKQWLI